METANVPLLTAPGVDTRWRSFPKWGLGFIAAILLLAVLNSSGNPMPMLLWAAPKKDVPTLRIHGGPEPPSRMLHWVPRVCTERYEHDALEGRSYIRNRRTHHSQCEDAHQRPFFGHVDASFQRNPVAFDIYRHLGGWATETEYVNVDWHGRVAQSRAEQSRADTNRCAFWNCCAPQDSQSLLASISL
eukprot:Skav228297  [mRNA]  locus=scaffold209:244436:251169:- [translate_table: standard]